MRRRSGLLTPVLAAAVAAVAAVAVVDAVRTGDGGAGADVALSPLGEEALHAALAELGVHGALHYVDAACLRRSLTLPDLTRGPAQRVACVDELRPRRPVPLVSSFPDGRPRAGCRRATDHLVGGRRFLRRLGGCARALRADGAALDARGAAVVARPPTCGVSERGCERIVLAPRHLRRAARRHPNVPASAAPLSLSVGDVAWLGGERHAVLLGVEPGGVSARRGRQELLAVFDRRRMAWTRPFFGSGPGGLAVSPRGSYVATTGVLSLTDATGRAVALAPPFADGHAVAWSPDERLTAVATRAEVLVVSTADLLAHARTGAAPSLLRIPVAVRELAWAERG